MTDITPQPESAAAPPTVQFMSADEINGLAAQLRENQAALLRGEPLPHTVTPDQIRRAVQSMRKNRGTMELAGSRAAASKDKAPKAGAKVTKINPDDLDLDF